MHKFFVRMSREDEEVSVAFFACLAQLDLTNPFRLEHLRCSYSSAGVGVKYGVDDVATPGLKIER
jgi:hypothetical protein